MKEDPAQFVVSEILSSLEYSLDRGEMEPPIKEVLPRIRYTDKRVKSFVVKLRGGIKVEISGTIIK